MLRKFWYYYFPTAVPIPLFLHFLIFLHSECGESSCILVHVNTSSKYMKTYEALNFGDKRYSEYSLWYRVKTFNVKHRRSISWVLYHVDIYKSCTILHLKNKIKEPNRIISKHGCGIIKEDVVIKGVYERRCRKQGYTRHTGKNELGCLGHRDS